MALSREARQIITILDEEGFGFIAGEIVTELSLGREIEAEIVVGEDNVRQDIIEADQLSEILRILRLRLIEPVRALAQAEQIAGQILNRPAIRIRFVQVDGTELSESANRVNPGDSQLADKLEDLLRRIPQMIEPDAPTRT